MISIPLLLVGVAYPVLIIFFILLVAIYLLSQFFFKKILKNKPKSVTVGASILSTPIFTPLFLVLIYFIIIFFAENS